MTRYRFLDGMGEVVAQEDFDSHDEALEWAVGDGGPEEPVQRVEHLDEQGEWRWSGALHG